MDGWVFDRVDGKALFYEVDLTFKNTSGSIIGLRATADWLGKKTGQGVQPDEHVRVKRRLTKTVDGIEVRFLLLTVTLNAIRAHDLTGSPSHL